MRFYSLILASLAIITLSACNEEYGGSGGNETALIHSDAMAYSSVEGSARSMKSVSSPPSAMALDRTKFNNRRIAETHDLRVENKAADLKARYDRDFKKCLDLGCEITSSQAQSRSNAYINARVAPENLGAYLDFLGSGVGELKSHAVRADDKTLQYIDKDSKIRNLETLKARLIKLLDSDKAKNVQQILQVERELNRVEQQLDTAKGSLRHLETVTGKATVNVRYNVPYQDVEVRYEDLNLSFKRAWKGFIRSISDVIEFVGGVLPWIPIWFIGFWVLIKAVRFAFKGFSWTFWKGKKNEPVKKASKSKKDKA